MKSKQTTEKIQKIITDQKELATRLATTLLAVATIGGGTVALSSCDEIELPKNPETSASEVTTEIPSEQATNSLTTTDEITFDTTEEVTTEAVEEINYEEELIKLLAKDYPEFENGIHSFEFSRRFNGGWGWVCDFRINPKDENNNKASTKYVLSYPISDETYQDITNLLGIELTNKLTCNTNDLTQEQLQYFSHLAYDKQILTNESQNELE